MTIFWWDLTSWSSRAFRAGSHTIGSLAKRKELSDQIFMSNRKIAFWGHIEWFACSGPGPGVLTAPTQKARHKTNRIGLTREKAKEKHTAGLSAKAWYEQKKPICGYGLRTWLEMCESA